MEIVWNFYDILALSVSKIFSTIYHYKIDGEVPSAQNYQDFDLEALTIITVEHRNFFEKSVPMIFTYIIL